MACRPLLSIAVCSMLATAGCSRSNNLLRGEVRGRLGTHAARVTDCYRTRPPQPASGPNRYQWEPCRDAVIVIDREQLSVNVKDYGRLAAGDSILVDHGVVSVGRIGDREHAQR